MRLDGMRTSATIASANSSTVSASKASGAAGVRRPTRERGVDYLKISASPVPIQDTEGDTKNDIVERKAKTTPMVTPTDDRLTFPAIGQVGPPIQSSTTLKV